MNRKIVWGALSAVMFISAGVLLFYFFWANGYIDPPKNAPTETYAEFTYPSLPDKIDPTLPSGNSEGKTGEQYDYVSPVDFEELKNTNPDIIGWIYMTAPYVSQPVLCSDDDTFYLSHAPNKEYEKNGSFFIESAYNKADFSDPCTIIYGHRQSDGSMFGNLQATISDIDIKNNSQYVVIYLPNETKIYHIIATIPYDNRHILYYNDFSTEAGYNKFIDRIYSTEGSDVQLVDDARPKYGEKILILSTCLRTDRTKRYLVVAKELT